MKTFHFLLIWASVLFLPVLSNNNAIGSELIFFYYVYKLQIASGLPRTIAVGCNSATGHGFCYFDEFVKHVIDPELWLPKYKPTSVDHTDTPGDSVLKSLNNGKPASARFVLNKLCSVFTEGTPMPAVLQTMLHAANDAVVHGGTEQGDLSSAISYAEQARKERSDTLLDYKLKDLKNVAGANVANYVVTTTDEFDLDETFENINEDVASGKISAAQGESYKTEIQAFSQGYGMDNGQPESQKSAAQKNAELHVSIIHEYQNVTDELGDLVEEEEDSGSSSGSSLYAPAAECDSDFITFGSDSEGSLMRRYPAGMFMFQEAKLNVPPIIQEVISGRRVLALRGSR